MFFPHQELEFIKKDDDFQSVCEALERCGYSKLASQYKEACETLNRLGVALFHMQLRRDDDEPNNEGFESLMESNAAFSQALEEKEKLWFQIMDLKAQKRESVITSERQLARTRKNMSKTVIALFLISLTSLIWLMRYEIVVGGRGDGYPLAYRLDRWTGNITVASPGGTKTLEPFPESN